MSVLLNKVINKSSIGGLTELPDNYVHLILSDIPYGIGAEDWDVLHDNKNSAYLGSSPAQAKAGAIFKKRGKPINGWSEADREIPKQYQEWCATWASEWFRVIKPGGSVIIFGVDAIHIVALPRLKMQVLVLKICSRGCGNVRHIERKESALCMTVEAM